MTSPTSPYQWFAFESDTRTVRYGYGLPVEASDYQRYLCVIYGAGTYRTVPLTRDEATSLCVESGQVPRCCDLADALDDIRERTGTTLLAAVESH